MTHAVFTGPVRTDVTLKDGTVVDVRPDVVYLDTLEQAHEVADAIGDIHAQDGHPWHDRGDTFVHDTKTSKTAREAAKKGNV